MQSVNLRDERLGKVQKNNNGSLMKIVTYNKANDIWVQFEKGKPVHATWKSFQKGDVRNPYDRTIYGVGFLGEGCYRSGIEKKGTRHYSVWTGMMERCYSGNFNRYPTYINCSVDDEWHNFQNFGKWYDENYYAVDDQKMELNKDILVKGNKVYGSKYCVFVPKRINLLLVKKDAVRGRNPVGVCYYKRDNTYQADCRDENGKSVHLGRYDTPEEAFEVYKVFKESIIKKVADHYKGRIPGILYEALNNYKVDIGD